MAFAYGWSDRHGPVEFDPNVALEELIDGLNTPYVKDPGGVEVCSVFTSELTLGGITEGLAEYLELPQGLSFEEVFARV